MKVRSWFVCSGVASVVLSGVATASDWYVNVVSGSDANAGTSPALAWRTITHALAVTPVASADGQVIHVAPGTYSWASGESFPLIQRNAFRIVSDGGSAATILDAGGSSAVITSQFNTYSHPPAPGPLTRVEGFTLINAATGVVVAASSASAYLDCTDLRILGMTTAGATCGSGSSLPEWGSAGLTLRRTTIEGCALGARVTSGGSGSAGGAALSLYDCVVSNSGSDGVVLTISANGGSVRCERTQLVGNAGYGLLATHSNPMLGHVFTRASLVDSLIASNAAGGVRGICNGGGSLTSLGVDVARCTLAENGGIGLDVTRPSASAAAYTATLEGCLLYGNVDDIEQTAARPTLTSVRYCDIGDGDFAGASGNIAADPHFRDAAAHDYRLNWGSPCIDRADPAAAVGSPDLLGVLRPVDGDLDAVETSDIGAFEFTPLALAAPAHRGGEVLLEQWGPAGGRCVLYLSRSHFVSTPILTPFGEFELDPLAVRMLGSTPAGSGPPAIRRLPLPKDDALVGQQFRFQALTRSGLASPVAAWTNLVTVTILAP